MTGRRPLLSWLFVFSVLSGCPSTDAPDAPFSYVLVDQPAGFFSVHGTSATDVWVAGGADGNGAGEPVLLHYGGDTWQRRDLGALGLSGIDLWWVHALSPTDVFIGGEAGTILRWDGATFARMSTPGTGTVFGIWAAAPNDVWAVGGDGGTAGFVWHFDGSIWSDVALPAGHPGVAVFKVWGTAPGQIWFCGLMGTLLRWDGDALTLVASPTDRPLFTVHAIDGEIAVAGGAGSGVLLRGTPEGIFSDVSYVPPMGGAPRPQMNGVWLTAPGEGYSVGIYGEIQRLVDGVWIEEEPIYDDLHAVWVDPSGGVWAVGGVIQSSPSRSGVVIHRGDPISSVVVEE